MMFAYLFRCLALLFAAMFSANVLAGIVINTTRVIYPGEDKEVSLAVHNTGTGEILVQSWLEANPEYKDPGRLPFVITPSLARLPGDGRQLLRIIHAGTDMPQDRESVLWLNVQEIPQVAAENALQVAIRQRIKVFFRPRGLVGDPVEAAQNLRWRLSAVEGLQVSNPGPYHVSMVNIGLRQGARSLLRKDSQMIAPGQTLHWPLERQMEADPVSLSFISINDFGGQEAYTATPGSSHSTQAVRDTPR